MANLRSRTGTLLLLACAAVAAALSGGMASARPEWIGRPAPEIAQGEWLNSSPSG